MSGLFISYRREVDAGWAGRLAADLKRDLPDIVARACDAHPGVIVRTTQALGEIDALLEAVAGWALDEHDATGSADLGHPSA